MSEKKQKSEPTPRQAEIVRLRKTPRDRRTEAAVDRLRQLVTEEKRERFNRLFPRRLERLKSAVRNMVRLGSPTAYQYTEEEAEAMVKAARAYAAEIERAFRGTPKEKGLFDL